MAKKNITVCTEAECLKDILWYIQGFKSSCEINNLTCFFDNEHLEALEEAIRVLQREPLTSLAKGD